MARKKEAKVEVVNEVAISKTLVLVTYSDGTSEIRFKLTSDELEKLVAAVSPAEDDEDDGLFQIPSCGKTRTDVLTLVFMSFRA